MDTLDAHVEVSRKAHNAAEVKAGLLDILLKCAGLDEALRKRSAAQRASGVSVRMLAP
ncbi:MAG: hypothetical protein FJ086_17475 [Deltaproteobacteria bacterium]|nr:hypothetical protein [Deltaproteobacteria bacterium]